MFGVEVSGGESWSNSKNVAVVVWTAFVVAAAYFVAVIVALVWLLFGGKQ